MQVPAQNKQPEPEKPSYKSIGKLELASKQQMFNLVSRYSDPPSMLQADLRGEAMALLRTPAQRAVLNALEVRTPEMDEDFGYEWEDALAGMNADPSRAAATNLFIERIPGSRKRWPTPRFSIAMPWSGSTTRQQEDLPRSRPSWMSRKRSWPDGSKIAQRLTRWLKRLPAGFLKESRIAPVPAPTLPPP